MSGCRAAHSSPVSLVLGKPWHWSCLEESTESNVRYSPLSEAIRSYVVYMTQLAHVCPMWG